GLACPWCLGDYGGEGLPRLTIPRLDSLLGNLRPGQTLSAVVAEAPRAGETLLRIAGRLVQARTGELKLTPGQVLRLEVLSAGRLPELRLLETVRAADTLREALRQILPQQRPLAPTLGALAQLAARPDLSRLIGTDAARLLRDLVQRLPDPARVSTPQGLRQAIRDAGPFLEARLAPRQPPSTPQQPAARNATAGGNEAAQAAQAARSDLKAGLLKLAAALRAGGGQAPATAARGIATAAPAPPVASGAASAAPPTATPPGLRPGADPALDLLGALRRGQPPRPQASVALRALTAELAGQLRQQLPAHVESALARLKLNQLASLPQDRAQPPDWLIELPVRRDDAIDLWALRISRDADDTQENGNRRQAAPSWTVTLAFDLPGLGPVQSRVTLQGKDRIMALFLSEQDDTLPRVEAHLPLLRQRLEQAGLSVESLACRRGRLPDPAGPAGAGPLLDDHA
ncbi:flagellar hook-length control protein FliK, partial [Thiohalobacter sp.]|uniref:flagellar hook-length control protein FliK n=1 Tax=Thiohalobacter sp. TaxID=2025948 RepID=UPI0026301B06